MVAEVSVLLLHVSCGDLVWLGGGSSGVAFHNGGINLCLEMFVNSTPFCQEKSVLISGKNWKVIAGRVYCMKENAGCTRR